MALHKSAPIQLNSFKRIEQYFADLAIDIQRRRAFLIEPLRDLCESNNWIRFAVLKSAGTGIEAAGLRSFLERRLREVETTHVERPESHSMYAGLSVLHYAIDDDGEAVRHISDRILNGDLAALMHDMSRVFYQLLNEFARQWALRELANMPAIIEAEVRGLGQSLDALDSAFGGRFRPTGDALLAYQAVNRIDPYTPAFDPGLLSGENFSRPPTPSVSAPPQSEEQAAPTAAVSIRAKTGGAKGKMIHARMLKTLSENPEAYGWTALEWAAQLKCSDGTIKGTELWKVTLKAHRAIAKAEKARVTDRRRGRRGAPV